MRKGPLRAMPEKILQRREDRLLTRHGKAVRHITEGATYLLKVNLRGIPAPQERSRGNVLRSNPGCCLKIELSVLIGRILPCLVGFLGEGQAVDHD